MEQRRPRGRVVKATIITTPNPNPHPQPVTEVHKQPKVTATRKRARPNNPEPKSTTATKPATGNTKMKAAASVKTAVAKPTTPDLVIPTRSSTTLLGENSDLESVPNQARVALTLRVLTYNPSLPTEAARPPDVLKTLILFVAEYGSTT